MRQRGSSSSLSAGSGAVGKSRAEARSHKGVQLLVGASFRSRFHDRQNHRDALSAHLAWRLPTIKPLRPLCLCASVFGSYPSARPPEKA